MRDDPSELIRHGPRQAQSCMTVKRNLRRDISQNEHDQRYRAAGEPFFAALGQNQRPCFGQYDDQHAEKNEQRIKDCNELERLRTRIAGARFVNLSKFT